MMADLLPATWQAWCFALLALAMLMALETDLRQRRISNVTVLFLLLAGGLLNVVGPANGRGGPFNEFPGALGVTGALLGALVGLLLLLPLYLLRAMGAGDVKLMAAIGAVVGPVEIIGVALFVLIAGGLFALARTVGLRKSRLVLTNIRLALSAAISTGDRRSDFDLVSQSAGRMPYALAFAAGLLAYAGWRLSGHLPLWTF